jgi:hypothetical protein
MTGQPEHVSPLAENATPEVIQYGYQAYPLVDHGDPAMPQKRAARSCPRAAP